jgi:hypothetical protein
MGHWRTLAWRKPSSPRATVPVDQPPALGWDSANRKHILVDHADRSISEERVTYAVENALDENVAPIGYTALPLGLCRVGRRVLAVAWVVRPGRWCYPVPAHWTRSA